MKGLLGNSLHNLYIFENNLLCTAMKASHNTSRLVLSGSKQMEVHMYYVKLISSCHLNMRFAFSILILI